MRIYKKYLMNENKTSDMIKTLKDVYGKINKIDPSSSAYKRLTTLLDGLPKDQLKTIANADIKFVSLLAKNRLGRK